MPNLIFPTLTPDVSCETLSALIGRPDAPPVFDLCLPEDFAANPTIIPGARRARHDDLPSLLDDINDPKDACVIVCQKGRKISQGAAAWLTARGQKALFLAGGIDAWRAAHLPTVALTGMPKAGRNGAIWALPNTPSLAVLQSAWIIKRWLDPRANVLYVDAAELTLVGEKFDAFTVDPESSTKDMMSQFALNAPRLDQWSVDLSKAPTRQTLEVLLKGHLALSHSMTDWQDRSLSLLDAVYASQVQHAEVPA
ncbi:MAG: rhodanese-like domain-containing protein [Pseudomonadota bacterium]